MPELQKDAVQNELLAEMKLLQETEIFFTNLLKELQEQLRKHRCVIFSLEADLHKKMTTLRLEKQNESIQLAKWRETRMENKLSRIDQIERNSTANG